MSYWIAMLKYWVLQSYYNLKFFDELPFQLMSHDYEDRRPVIQRPQR